jgi:hypothetical protein
MPRPTNKVTIADILAYGPCRIYTQERLEELFAGRDAMSIDDILATDIPPDHKLDCILRVGLIPKAIETKLAKFATDGMSSDGNAVIDARLKDTIADTRNKNAKRAKETDAVSEAIVLSLIDKLEDGWTKGQRRAVIESSAEIQLNHLLNLLDEKV